MKIELQKIKFWNKEKEEGAVTFHLILMDVPWIRIKQVKLVKKSGRYYISLPYKTFIDPKNKKVYYTLVEVPFAIKEALIKSCGDYIDKLKEGKTE